MYPTEGGINPLLFPEKKIAGFVSAISLILHIKRHKQRLSKVKVKGKKAGSVY